MSTYEERRAQRIADTDVLRRAADMLAATAPPEGSTMAAMTALLVEAYLNAQGGR